MIEFLAVLHEKNFDYHSLEGIMLLKRFCNFLVISYSQICRRVNSLDSQIYHRINDLEINFNINEENVIVGVDGSGNKVSNRGEWIRHKWKTMRGWVKAVAMKTTKGKTVGS